MSSGDPSLVRVAEVLIRLVQRTRVSDSLNWRTRSIMSSKFSVAHSSRASNMTKTDEKREETDINFCVRSTSSGSDERRVQSSYKSSRSRGIKFIRQRSCFRRLRTTLSAVCRLELL